MCLTNPNVCPPNLSKRSVDVGVHLCGIWLELVRQEVNLKQQREPPYPIRLVAFRYFNLAILNNFLPNRLVSVAQLRFSGQSPIPREM